MGSPMHAVAKLRMLFTLKNVLRALRSKRFVVEAPSSVAGLSPEGAFPPHLLAKVLATMHLHEVSMPARHSDFHGQWHGVIMAHSPCRPSEATCWVGSTYIDYYIDSVGAPCRSEAADRPHCPGAQADARPDGRAVPCSRGRVAAALCSCPAGRTGCTDASISHRQYAWHCLCTI